MNGHVGFSEEALRKLRAERKAEKRVDYWFAAGVFVLVMFIMWLVFQIDVGEPEKVTEEILWEKMSEGEKELGDFDLQILADVIQLRYDLTQLQKIVKVLEENYDDLSYKEYIIDRSARTQPYDNEDGRITREMLEVR